MMLEYYGNSNPQLNMNDFASSWLVYNVCGRKAYVIKRSSPIMSFKLFIPHRGRQTDHMPITKHQPTPSTDGGKELRES